MKSAIALVVATATLLLVAHSQNTCSCTPTRAGVCQDLTVTEATPDTIRCTPSSITCQRSCGCDLGGQLECAARTVSLARLNGSTDAGSDLCEIETVEVATCPPGPVNLTTCCNLRFVFTGTSDCEFETMSVAGRAPLNIYRTVSFVAQSSGEFDNSQGTTIQVVSATTTMNTVNNYPAGIPSDLFANIAANGGSTPALIQPGEILPFSFPVNVNSPNPLEFAAYAPGSAGYNALVDYEANTGERFIMMPVQMTLFQSSGGGTTQDSVLDFEQCILYEYDL
mmetsp:Transcript_21793/g.53815  ORF Transcript_21793/g.53815 Transcript_21793/m.53815 type:complete len:281 (+) Transcript_21793:63-905(+)